MGEVMSEVITAILSAISLAKSLYEDGIVKDLAEVARRWGASDEDLKTAIARAQTERQAIIAKARKAEWP